MPKSILPFVERTDSRPIDGSVYEVPDFCRTIFNHKCEKHYWDLGKSKPGTYKCPYGLYTLKMTNGGLVTCFAIKGKVSKETKARITSNGVQAFSSERLSSLLKVDLSSLDPAPLPPLRPTILLAPPPSNLYEKSNEKSSPSAGLSPQGRDVPAASQAATPSPDKALMHEMRPLNNEIKVFSKELEEQLDSLMKQDETKFSTMKHNAANISNSSEMMTLRMDLYEALDNPKILTSSLASRKVGVRKSFDKVRRMYYFRSEKSGKSIKTEGLSYSEIEGYKFFDLVPFLLYDNSIKYSKTTEPSVAIFSETKNGIHIDYETTGPYICEDELQKIFSLGGRGRNADKHEGSGIGLFLVKTIIEAHGGTIECASTKVGMLNGRDYGRALFKMRIPLIK